MHFEYLFNVNVVQLALVSMGGKGYTHLAWLKPDGRLNLVAWFLNINFTDVGLTGSFITLTWI